jgi:CheY-like chemotaxis protein
MMPTEPRRILLFEDDFESMRYFKEDLEEELGWSVELTAAGDVIERLGQEQFDLVILDLMIQPKSLDAQGQEVKNVHFDDVPWQRTGLEFLRRLRAGDFSRRPGTGTSPDVPVMVLSAVAGDSIERKLGPGVFVNDHLEKPFRLDELVRRVRQLLKD